MPGISVAPPASSNSAPSRGRLSPGLATASIRFPWTSTSPGRRSFSVPSKIITFEISVLAIVSSVFQCFSPSIHQPPPFQLREGQLPFRAPVSGHESRKGGNRVMVWTVLGGRRHAAPDQRYPVRHLVA